MPKNKGKGGKYFRRGKHDTDDTRDLVTKEEGQEYAQVTKMLGNGRLEAKGGPLLALTLGLPGSILAVFPPLSYFSI